MLSKTRESKTAQWPAGAVAFIDEYMKLHPCFYLEELQEAVKVQFRGLLNTSTPTICRLLRSDLGISRKILAKRTRESVPAEIEVFYKKLQPFYSGPD